MKYVYSLQNLHCANCAAKMEAGVAKLEGVSACSVNFMLQRMTVETVLDMDKPLFKSIKKLVSGIEPQVKIKEI